MPMITFDAAVEFRDFLSANVSFIRGKLKETPSHLGPLDRESQPIKGLLASINREGLFTTDSQPGKRGRLKQRAYLLGWMPSKRAINLFHSISAESKLVPIAPMADKPRRSGDPTLIPVTMEDGYPYTLIGTPETTKYSFGRAMKGLLFVQFCDGEFGRRDWLFRKILSHLRRTPAKKNESLK